MNILNTLHPVSLPEIRLRHILTAISPLVILTTAVATPILSALNYLNPQPTPELSPEESLVVSLQLSPEASSRLSPVLSGPLSPPVSPLESPRPSSRESPEERLEKAQANFDAIIELLTILKKHKKTSGKLNNIQTRYLISSWEYLQETLRPELIDIINSITNNGPNSNRIHADHLIEWTDAYINLLRSKVHSNMNNA